MFPQACQMDGKRPFISSSDIFHHITVHVESTLSTQCERALAGWPDPHSQNWHAC